MIGILFIIMFLIFFYTREQIKNVDTILNNSYDHIPNICNSPVGHKWTENIINSINSMTEKQRLVDSGLYTEQEYKDLCDLSNDYDNRIIWSSSHSLIEKRERSEGSKWIYDSPVDEILVIYRSGNKAEVRGYKSNKRVLTWDISFNNYDDFRNKVTNPLHILDRDPIIIGRTVNKENWIGFNGDSKKIVLNDD